MQCQSCNTVNQPSAKFCIECGTAFPSNCEKCGFPNQAAAKFCQECGATLRAASASQSVQIAKAPPNLPKLTIPEPSDGIPDGERKTVTALFADIKGSTELMEDLDPEEARAIVDPALKLMM